MMPGAGTSRVSTLVMALSVGAGVWLLATAAGSTRSTAVSGLAGVVLGVAVLVRAGETPLRRSIASLLVPVTAVLVLGGVGLSVLDSGVSDVARGVALPTVARSLLGHVGVSVAAGAGGFGVVGTVADGIGDGAVSRFWRTAIATQVVLTGALGVVLLARFDALASVTLPSNDLTAILDPVVRPADPRVALVTFWLVVGAFVVVLRRTLSTLPLVELAGRPRRERLATALDRVDATLRSVATLLVVATLASVLGFVTEPDAGVFAMEAIQPGLAVLEAPGLRLSLVSVAVVLGGITLLVGGLQRLTGSVTDTLGRILPSVLGGCLTVVAVWVASPVVPVLRSAVPATYRQPVSAFVDALTPTGTLLAVVAVAVFGLTVLLATLAGAGGVRYLPSRSAGGALAGGGLAVGAIVVGVVSDAPLVVFAVVALSIVAWNASERGVTTRAELGARPAVHLDVVHTIGALAVAVPGAALAWLVYANVLADIAVPGGTLVGVLSTVATSLVLVVALRG